MSQWKAVQAASIRTLAFLVCTGGLAGYEIASAQAKSESFNQAPITLKQAIELALRQNRTLQLAGLSVKDVEEKKKIARSEYFPHIKNESSMLYVTELAGVNIPAGAFGVSPATGPIPSQSLFIGQGSDTAYTSGTGLAQPLTQLLKIREANRAASADISTAKIRLVQRQDEIALRVMQLYYELRIERLKLQAAMAEVKASELKSKESEDTVVRGEALEVAALESHAALLDAKQAVLTQRLKIHDLNLAFNNLLGIPLSSDVQLDESTSEPTSPHASREECMRIAEQRSPDIQAAQQAVVKSRAGLAAAKDEYIPNVTGIARYSYQSGVPLLVHNFGTFGVNFSYELFEGGRRSAEIRDARTLLSEAETNLTRTKDDLAVQVEVAYDKVEQLQSMVEVAAEVRTVRVEAARLADRQLEQSTVLQSVREEAHSKLASAEAAYLEATLGLLLAQGELKRTIGQMPQ
jgi:outer membrane protein TolC